MFFKEFPDDALDLRQCETALSLSAFLSCWLAKSAGTRKKVSIDSGLESDLFIQRTRFQSRSALSAPVYQFLLK